MIIAHKYLSGLAGELGYTLRTAKSLREKGIIVKVQLKNTKERPGAKEAEKRSKQKSRGIIWVYGPSFVEEFAKGINKPGRGKIKSV